MRRKLHFGEFEVVKFKRKHCGAELPPNQVLVKLRRPGERPNWKCLDWQEFRRERSFRRTYMVVKLKDRPPRHSTFVARRPTSIVDVDYVQTCKTCSQAQ